MSPIHEWLRKTTLEDVQRALDEIERLQRDGTWPSGITIAAPGELSQEIARWRIILGDLERKLEKLK